MVNSIKTLEEINTLRNWFKCHNDKSYDFHLLYFDLGINTCYTIDELQNLKWYELLNNDGTVVDSIMDISSLLIITARNQLLHIV